MPRLVWETIGLGVIESWYREDGSTARCVVRIVGTTAQFEISARRPIVDVLPPITVRMRHTEFDLERCKWLAETIEAEYPLAPNDERVLQDLIDAHRKQQLEAIQQATGAARCQFVHAWRPYSRDSDVCQCGSLTKGYARECGLAVPA